MMKQAAHTRSWETGETILITALLLGLVLGLVLPLPLSRWLPRLASVALGVALLVLSFSIISVTRRQFREARQPTDPGQPTTQIITTGIFARSRNPLYLAGVILFLGLGLLFNALWLVLLVVPVIIAFQIILIAPEEQYLEAKFGEPYRQYRHAVRRWLGRF